MMPYFLMVVGWIWGVNAYAEARYDDYFPLYVQSCALTRIKSVRLGSGARWGHSVAYVKGMCRDKSAPYPKVQVCDPSIDLSDPNSGTLVSVGREFQNTNWIAIEGGNLAFHGNLDPEEAVTSEALEKVKDEVLKSGSYRGISFNRSWYKFRRPEMSQEQNTVELGVGTHFALDFGRTAFCNLIPINELQLQSIVNFLNRINEPFVLGVKKYHWDPLNNNCVHLVRNILAAAKVCTFKPVRIFYLLTLFDLVFPGKDFVSMAQSFAIGPLEVTQAYRSLLDVQSFEEFGVPSVPVGVITRVMPIRSNANELFIPSSDLTVGVFRKKDWLLTRVLANHTLNDLAFNLERALERLLTLRSELRPLEELKRKKRRYRKPSFQIFYERYTSWLETTLVEVEDNLQRLRAHYANPE